MTNRDTTDQRPSEGTATDDSQDVAVLAVKVLTAGRQRSASGAAALPVWQSQPRPWWRRGLSAAWVLAVWSLILVLGSVAALRIFYHDGTYVLVCLNAFTLYLYLPAYASLAWAAWRRRWFLATASGLIVLCHLAWVGPDFRPAASFSPPSPGAAAPSPTMRIFCANAMATNTEYQSLLSEIAAADPDVVVLVEYSEPWHRALKDSPVLAPYVYRPARINLGQVTWYSRLPIANIEETSATNRHSPILTIRLGNDLVRLLCLHGPRPMEYTWYDYVEYWKLMLPLLARQSGPLVVVGDFNATQHSRVYEELMSGRLRSAHEDRGRGYATTWPNGQFWLPPIRIDQALLSPEVQCVGIAEGRGKGSDHKPLILDVRVGHDWPTVPARSPTAEGGQPAAGG
jgi:endonuclease/exonuclease/phosphatase (EEP) superfamily protein YafD